MSNGLDTVQARHFIGSDLGPNCLQMLLADTIISIQSRLGFRKDELTF